MPVAPTRWIKRLAEFCPKGQYCDVPRKTRGIYVLFFKRGEGVYNVAYVGLSKSGIRGRLYSHHKSPSKSALWTHFSIFEVWENVSDAEINELEGLFRHIYRLDAEANRLNKQKTYKPLKKAFLKLSSWKGR
jgi:hypothetical protein